MVPHAVKLLSPAVIRDVCSKTTGSWEGVLKDMAATGMSQDGEGRVAGYLPYLGAERSLIVEVCDALESP